MRKLRFGFLERVLEPGQESLEPHLEQELPVLVYVWARVDYSPCCRAGWLRWLEWGAPLLQDMMCRLSRRPRFKMLKRRRPWRAVGPYWKLVRQRLPEQAGLQRMTLVLPCGLMWLQLQCGCFECDWWMLQLLPRQQLCQWDLFWHEGGDGLLGPSYWLEGLLGRGCGGHLVLWFHLCLWQHFCLWFQLCLLLCQ